MYPRPLWNFVELEASIDVVLVEAEVNERRDTALAECVMCTDSGSQEDVAGMLADILLVASEDQESSMDATSS